MDERKRAATLRRIAQYGGRHVICLACGTRGRHQLNSAARLRDRVCAACGSKTVRLVTWVVKNPERAEREATLARLGIFATVPRSY